MFSHVYVYGHFFAGVKWVKSHREMQMIRSEYDYPYMAFRCPYLSITTLKALDTIVICLAAWVADCMLESWNTVGDKMLHLLDSSSLRVMLGLCLKWVLFVINIELHEVQGCMYKVLLVVLVTQLALLGWLLMHWCLLRYSFSVNYIFDWVLLLRI
jgi:hypothetical protein